MSEPSTTPSDITNLVNRLKARLALANFKREHGCENVDLRTLESSLYEHKFGHQQDTAQSTVKSPCIQDRKKRKLLSHHRFYPTSPPLQHNDMDRLIKKNASRSPPSVPTSETRSQHSPHYINRKLSATLSSDDEDAAHLLVMMHQSPTMSS